MPDSTNQDPINKPPIKKILCAVDRTLPGEDFSALAHIGSLCGKRVTLSELGTFYYSSGWCSIIEDFMNDIHSFRVTLDTVHENMGQLDISFTCYQKCNEVKVWRASFKAINLSRRTCILCGAHGSRLVIGRDVTTLCGSNDCILANREPSMLTGTWLDKF